MLNLRGDVMSVKLLDRTRKISRLLHNNSSYVVVFNDICKLLGDMLEANIMVISARGKMLGIYEREDISSLTNMLTDNIGEVIDEELNDRFLSVLSTKENVNLSTLGFEGDIISGLSAVVMPIDFAGERLGTTFIYRSNSEFEIEDIILCEYANTVVELEMMRSIYEEDVEEKRRTNAIDAVFSSLSASERKAIGYVFKELDGQMEGTIIASRIAEQYGITRSIIVNAIQKLEGAGILIVRSKGMKGTHLIVCNDTIYERIDLKG